MNKNRKKQNLIFVFLFAFIMLLSGCSDKSVNQSDLNQNNINISADITSPELAQYISMFRLQVTGMFMDPIDVTVPYEGGALTFELDIPAGSQRTFVLEAIEFYQVTTQLERVIYRGTTTVDINPDAVNNIEIPMRPVIPLIKFTPLETDLAPGQPFVLRIEVFNIPDLKYIRSIIDFDDILFSLDSIVKGSTLEEQDILQSTFGGDYNYFEVEVLDPAEVGASIVDQNGYSDLLSIYFTPVYSTVPIASGMSIFPSSLVLNNQQPFPIEDVYIHNASITGQALNDYTVTFPDTQLDWAVRNTIYDSTSNPILLSKLLTITYLNCNDLYVQDLTGIDEIKNLDYLDFRNNSVTDYSLFNSLPHLRSLLLDGNYLSSVQQFSNLTQLHFLSLDYNEIVDVSPLALLSGLESLTLQYNLITDISPILNSPHMERLKYLYARNNQITKFTPMTDMPNLIYFYLDSNGLTDIQPLGSLSSLRVLSLTNNQIVDVTPLASLTNIITLDLENNLITDISPLLNNSGLGSGDYIDLQGNNLDANSVEVVIPALVARGVYVYYPQ